MALLFLSDIAFSLWVNAKGDRTLLTVKGDRTLSEVRGPPHRSQGMLSSHSKMTELPQYGSSTRGGVLHFG